MIKLTCRPWTSIERNAVKAQHKIAAVAYVSDDTRVKFGHGDTLVVDASDEQIRSGATSAHVLDRTVRRRAQVYSLPKLHAKLMVFDNIVIIGSANISGSSTTLKEVGLVSDSPKLVENALSIIDALKRDRKSQRVNKTFIKRISKIVVKRNGRHGNGHEEKPTILEAFQTRSSQLDSFVFGTFDRDRRLTKSRIKEAAKEKGLTLPKGWT